MHELPYTKDGCTVLVAIDSRGDERRRVQLRPGVAYGAAMSWLRELLDRVDPLPQRPKLELVRDVPTLPGTHPAHANDYPAYRRRLIRQLSHRVRRFGELD